jgi:hypothetical protein
LLRLPVDARARCACVCRGWRVVTAEVSLWTRLDLSSSSGVRVRVTDGVLRGAVGLARGSLTALDVSGRADVTQATLLAVVTANAAALTELRACSGFGRELYYATTETLLRAAPLLRVLDADVSCSIGPEATRLLRNEAPFGPLRMHLFCGSFNELAAAEVEADATALAASLAAHATLSSLRLLHAPLTAPAVLDAVVDAVLLQRVRWLELYSCDLSPASAPALARLLSGSALTELAIWNGGEHLLDAPAAALLADALRANSTITALGMNGISLLSGDAEAAMTLLGALTGHPSLRMLRVCYNPVGARVAAVGAALSALVAANTPALHVHVLSSAMPAALPALSCCSSLVSWRCVSRRSTASSSRVSPHVARSCFSESGSSAPRSRLQMLGSSSEASYMLRSCGGGGVDAPVAVTGHPV